MLIFLAVIVLQGNAEEFYSKVIHNLDPEAKCLDGSPGLIYVHEGGDYKKIMLFFLGGGFCAKTTLEGTL